MRASTSDTATRRARRRTRQHRPARVALVSMPYGALERPSLGLGLLQAALRSRSIPCQTHYLGFTFADFIGVDEYVFMSGALPYTAFAGDWSFTAAAFGEAASTGYIDDVLRDIWRLDDDAVRRVLAVRAHAEPFLEHCLRAVDWGGVDVVGFTSTFEQNVASLALARRLKDAHPGLVVAFGGANWEGEMGEELLARFPFVDLVCSGEADESFPAAVEAIAAGTLTRRRRRPGASQRWRARATTPPPDVHGPWTACRSPTSTTSSPRPKPAAAAAPSSLGCSSRHRAAAGGGPSSTAPSAA